MTDIVERVQKVLEIHFSGQPLDFIADEIVSTCFDAEITKLRSEREALVEVLRELQRYGPPGQPEKGCWCGAVLSGIHSPGCKAARTTLTEIGETG